MSSNGKTNYVAYVSPGLWQHRTLSLQAKSVATILLMHRNQKSGKCYVTQQTVAAELRVKRNTVIRALQELRDSELVTWENRKATRGLAKGRGNEYDLAGLLELCALSMERAETFLGVSQTNIGGGVSETNTCDPDAVSAAEEVYPKRTSRGIPNEHRASDFRPKEQNKNRIDSKSHSLSRGSGSPGSLSAPGHGKSVQSVSERGGVSQTNIAHRGIAEGDDCAATTILTARRQLSWPLRSG